MASNNNEKQHWFISMISSTSGDISSKRIITLLAALIFIGSFIAEIFTDLDIPEYMFDGLLNIVMVGLGANTVEHFNGTRRINRSNDIYNNP